MNKYLSSEHNLFRNGTVATTTNASSTNSTDVFYGPVDPALVITSGPWKVVDCNNTLQITAESLSDLTLKEDYLTRVPAYFTMDVRYIRKYKDANAGCPDQIVYFKNMNKVPSILQGSASCIEFSSTLNETDTKFSMCLKTPQEAAEILDSFSNFQICRMGGDLKPYNPLKVDELLKAACMEIPSTHKEDERDPFKDQKKDKNGKPLPKINVHAVKDFFKSNLVESGVS